MDYKSLEKFLLSFPGASLSFPFDDKTPVLKVAGKMFALLGIEKTPLSINLKCDPDDAQILRSQFKTITPGYHMNKEHWNTVLINAGLDEDIVKKLISDSYALVVKSLSKTKRKELGF